MFHTDGAIDLTRLMEIPHLSFSLLVSAQCGGELTKSSGTILSPDWPQSYSKGLDCVWQIHGNEEKRVELDIHMCVFADLTYI